MDLPLHEILVTRRFKMSALVLLPLLLLSVVSGAKTEAKYRLPVLAQPLQYKLFLEPNLENTTFTGEVTIKLMTLQKTSILVLNQLNLEINETDVTLINNNNKLKKLQKDEEHEFLKLEFEKELESNKTYELKIKYSGEFNKQNRGFYKSRYFEGQDKKPKWIATTHFEPTGARLAFPCWDEPAYKAVFIITIKHLPKYTSISNMPVEAVKSEDNKNITVFLPTPPMSTYLVAFVVSDYAYTSTEDNKFRVFTKPSAVNQTKYALDFGVKVIERLDNFTNEKYGDTMKKMDQVSIKDFNPGAMENWGLVTYRETALLYEEGVTTTRSKQSIATIIAHEFAHQWFGNLVSPKWWEYIWLNEGFANFFQYYITNQIEPSWRLMELYVVDITQGNAFIADANLKSRPMNQAVDAPKAISALFDSIAYQKAGSVIRMMSHILTEQVFRAGLQQYLKDNKLSVADSANLIDHLQNAAKNKTWAGQKFATIMDTWITKAGYPLVTVKKSGDNKYTLSQERFLLYESDNNTKWWVPITYTTKDNRDFDKTEPAAWLKQNENLEISDAKGWILINKQQTGYYRVNYEEENWKLLTDFLQTNLTEIHPLNRAQLLDDALTLARANRMKYNTALSLTLYLTNETDYIPWMTTFRNLNFLNSMMYNSDKYIIFQNYIKYTLKSLTNKYQYQISSNDSHVEKLLKTSMMKWACKAGVQTCVMNATNAFNQWLNGSTTLNPDQKTNILCSGLASADKAKWNETLTKLASSTKDPDERNSLLTVMGCSNSNDILKDFLLLSLNENSPISFEFAVQGVVANYLKGVDLVLDVLEKHYEQIKTLDKYEAILQSCIETLGNVIVTPAHYLRLSTISIKVGAQPDVVQSAVQKSTRNIEWVNTYGKTVDDWLVEHEKLFNSSGALAFSSLLLIVSLFITRFY